MRSTDILPTGRNIHAFDPFRMPTAFACRQGADQAQMLLDKHTCLPKTVALVLWGSDNIKSDGAQIAQALALMGAKPRFDSFGRLSGADLIPITELGRPRIDVIMTLSGIFRDLLPLQTRMLAEAAFKAATAEEDPRRISCAPMFWRIWKKRAKILKPRRYGYSQMRKVPMVPMSTNWLIARFLTQKTNWRMHTRRAKALLMGAMESQFKTKTVKGHVVQGRISLSKFGKC